jgi:hypothetical protein
VVAVALALLVRLLLLRLAVRVAQVRLVLLRVLLLQEQAAAVVALIFLAAVQQVAQAAVVQVDTQLEQTEPQILAVVVAALAVLRQVRQAVKVGQAL